MIGAPAFQLHLGNCLDVLPTLPSASVDAVVTDPPYACVDRPYGRLTETAWHDLMRGVVHECRRVLKPTGSAVFILQPNSETVGRMRCWLWDFLSWVGREWGIVQDCYWWNMNALPTVHSQRRHGLLRPSVKHCVWCGPPDCYRNQQEVLWTPSDATKAADRSDRALQRRPSGHHIRPARIASAADDRGGTTPFNLLPVAGSCTGRGHSASTPLAVCSWWVRYVCPPGGTVLDPFAGSGTVGEAALQSGRGFVGVERDGGYLEIARQRLGG